MMRIGVAGCFHESNTFAPGKTELHHFENDWVVGKDAFYRKYSNTSTGMGGVIDAAVEEDFELVPLFYANAIPSGTVSKEAMRTIIEKMVNEVEKASETLDGLVLILHGAMVSENFDDVEGEVLQQIRSKFPTKPIATTLDLHANISTEMIRHSNIIVGYDTYPHIDMYDRAVEASKWLVSTIQKKISPVHHMEKPNLLVTPSTMDTNKKPMLALMEKAFAYEKDPEVINVLVAGGFPYSDIDFAGISITVTTDNNRAKAKEIAQELVGWVKNHQKQFQAQSVTPDRALQRVEELDAHPIILIESSDNVGGGSPADATHTLKALLSHQQEKFLMFIADPEAVDEALNLGINGTFSMEIGGKTDHREGQSPLHGEPVPVKGTVRLLSNGDFVHHGPHKTGLKASMGKTAVIELENCPESIIVLTERRVSPRDINQTRSIGLDAEAFKVIVVKAAIAWKTAFGQIAKHTIELDTPGCCSGNLQHLDYKKVPKTINRI